MTRVSLALAALAAAGITAASIGFAVFWAYGPGDVPRETVAVPVPVETASQPNPDSTAPKEARSASAPAVPAQPATGKTVEPQRAAAPSAPAVLATAPAAPPRVAAQPVAPIAEPARPSATRQENVAALPQPAEKTREGTPVTSEPRTGAIRGSRRIVAARPHTPPQPPQRPDPAQIATNAQTIIVLRGGHWPRYAMAGKAEPGPVSVPVLVVLRGARPAPYRRSAYAQPNALILHVRD